MADFYASSYRQDTFPPTYLRGGTGPNFVACIQGRFAVVADDVGAADRLFVAQLPSDVRLLRRSVLRCSALTGATDNDFGDANDPDGLLDGQTFATATEVSAINGVAIGNNGKMLWEQLGYTEDPGGLLDLYVTFNAAPTANGTLYFELHYLHP